ncbi:MAG: hypothetical protein GY778_00705, partial [bacterium]|nr:hypothetical protein [bacterium]
MTRTDDAIIKLGAVSFLNARPLVEGLDDRGDVELLYAVPSALPSMLQCGRVDAALVPVIDWAHSAERGGAAAWERVSDACIACDGESLTVRVFSRVPPEEMSVLHVDMDSHTSIALARLIWQHRHDRPLTLVSLSPARTPRECESVLLIGDKVVNGGRRGFEFEI